MKTISILICIMIMLCFTIPAYASDDIVCVQQNNLEESDVSEILESENEQEKDTMDSCAPDDSDILSEAYRGEEPVDTGSCGDSITWNFYSDGRLVLEGTGRMYDYNIDIPSYDEYYDRINDITVSNGITYIGRYAFFGYEVESFTAGDGLKEIGSNAFCECRALRTAVLPDSVEIINESAFNSCFSLDSINFPASLKTIGDNAFQYCQSLSSVSFNEALETIGVNAFISSAVSGRLYIPENVSGIQYGSDFPFIDCSGITEFSVSENNRNYASLNGVLFSRDMTTLIRCPEAFAGDYTVPATVTDLSPYAFYGCTGLTSIDLTYAELTKISDHAFTYCSQIETLAVPEGVSVIEGAFDYCYSLKKIYIPASVCYFDTCTFGDSYAFEGCVVDSANENYITEDGVLFSRDRKKLYIYPQAKTELSYTVPDTVESIEEKAFYGALALTEINIPASVKSIGQDAFMYCSSLESAVIPGAKILDEGAFSCCNALESVSLPEGLKYIGDYAFEYCTALNSIEIPSTVRTIGSGAFESCQIEEITVPEGVKRLSDNIFLKCYNLKSVILPETLIYIGPSAFENCRSLEKLYIPDSVSYIGDSAFRFCTAMKSIHLPDSLMTVSESMFCSCEKLEQIVLSSKVIKVMQYAFEYCSSLKQISFPESVKEIHENVFYSCPSLVNVCICGTDTETAADIFDNLDHNNTIIFTDNEKTGNEAESAGLLVKPVSACPYDISLCDIQISEDGSTVSVTNGDRVLSYGISYTTDITDSHISVYGCGAYGSMYCKYKDYRIQWHLDGGTNSSLNPVLYNETDEIRFKEPEKQGYTFAGWYTDVGCTKRIYGISRGTSGDIDVYAKWIKTDITVNTPAGITVNRNDLEKTFEKYAEKYSSYNTLQLSAVITQAGYESYRMIKNAAGNSDIAFCYDIRLTLTGDGRIIDDGSGNDTLISITYDLDFSGVQGVRVLREHSGTVQEITGAPNAYGEYIINNTADGKITVMASKYSAYSVVLNKETDPVSTGDKTDIKAILFISAAAVFTIIMAFRRKYLLK